MLKYVHVIVFSVILLICCLLYLLIDSKQAKTYNPSQLSQLEVKEIYSPLPEIFSTDINNINNENNPSNTIETTKTTPYTQDQMLQEYQELYQSNNDFAGWIDIENVLSLPVMYAPNTPEFYLNHYFDKTAKSQGTPYIDERSNFNLMSDNVIIYGHNMNNDSVFCPLINYTNEEFYNNNKIISFNTLYEKHEYEIISVFTSTFDGVTENIYFQGIDFENMEEFENFTQDITTRSIYNNDKILQYGDKFITLMTCTNVRDIDRINVIAVKIS